MKLAIAGKPLGFKGRFADCFNFLANLGLNADEVQFVRGIWATEKSAIEIKRNAEKAGIWLSVHAPYYVNLCSSKEKVVENSIKFIKRTAEIGSKMGAHFVVFHSGYYGNLDEERAFQVVKEAIEKIITWMESKGIEITIAPETMGSPKKFGSVDEMIRLKKELKSKLFLPTIDWAHIHARCNGCLRKEKDFEEILKQLKKGIGSKELSRIHMHFTGVEYTLKGEKRHLPIDVKQFEELAKALKKFNLKNTSIVCESPLLEKDALKMKKILEAYGLYP